MKQKLRYSVVSFLALSGSIISATSYASTLGFSITPAASSSFDLPFLPHSLSASPVTVDVRDDQTLQEISDAQVSMASDGSITVTHAGYAAVTLIGAKSGQITIYLKQLTPASQGPIISGTMGNYTVSDDSSLARAGMVYRAMSADDLLNFQMSSVVSPLKDTIDVYGSHNIPSNIVLPQQSVDIVLGSVDLNKPNYRLPIAPGVSTVLAGMQGEMQASDLTSIATGGGSITPAVLNKLTFDRVGFTQPFTPTGDMNLDVPATYDLTGSVQVSASAAPYQSDIIVVAVSDINGDRRVLVPTDIKDASQSSRAQSIKLKTTASPMGTSQDLVAIAFANNGNRISGVISPVAGSRATTGAFLNNPDLSDFDSFPSSVSIDAASQGVGMITFEAAANDQHGKTAVWFVYTLPSAGALTISSAANPTSETLASYSVNQLDFGPSFNEASIDGQTIMQGLQRFSRSAAAQQQQSQSRKH